MAKLPKRFYKLASVAETSEGYGVELDGRGIKTDNKKALIVPTHKLAAGVAGEWDAQVGEIDLSTMPLTRLAKTAVDRGAIDRGLNIDEILKFSNSDLLCYRAADPNPLVKRQVAGWQPVLDWASDALDVRFEVTAGLVVLEQPAASLESLRSHVEPLSDFEVAGLAPTTALLGSIILAMAVFKGHLTPNDALSLSLLDELWQAEMWGEDDEAVARREGLLRDLESLASFLVFLT